MALSKQDLLAIRRPLIVSAVILLVGGASGAGSYFFRQQAIAARHHQQILLQQAHSQYTEAVYHAALIREYLPRYQDLNTRGRVGDEQRLTWVEALQASADPRYTQELSYHIENRAPFSAVLAGGAGEGAQVFTSAMSLHLRLTHEGHFIALFPRLEQYAAGLYGVKSCVLRRNDTRLHFGANESNVSAECDLRWYTVRPTSAATDAAAEAAS